MYVCMYVCMFVYMYINIISVFHTGLRVMVTLLPSVKCLISMTLSQPND